MSEELETAGLPVSFTSSKVFKNKNSIISGAKNRKKKAQKKAQKKKKQKSAESYDAVEEVDLYNYAEEFKINQVLQDYKDSFTILMDKSERFKPSKDDEENNSLDCEDYPENEDEDDQAEMVINETTEISLSTPSPLSNNQIKKLAMKNSLQKYYHQRYNFFKLFDSGIQIDEEGWYSVTPEKIADHIAQEALSIAKTAAAAVEDSEDATPKQLVILDAFCGVGGNTIQFAKYFDKVLAVDLDPTRLSMARNNAEIYGVSDRITFIHGDVFEVLKEMGDEGIDLVFMSPPWGGPDYISKPVFCARDDFFDGRGLELFQLGRSLSKNLILFLPRQCDIFSLAKMVKDTEGDEIKDDESFVVEQHWLRNRLVAISAYFYS